MKYGLDPLESKRLIDEYLIPVLAGRVSQAEKIDPAYAALWIAIQTLFQAGGKRLRPYMVLLAFRAFSDEPLKAVIPAAAAQELLHLALLIHDDIIDRDLVRYGVDNVTAEFLKQYETLIKQEGDRLHYAQSAAILAGDLLIAEAFLQVSKADAEPEQLANAGRVLNYAMFNVVGGQLLDTEAAFKAADSAHPLVIAEHKTASYSFVSPLLMGAILGGARQAQQTLLTELGKILGTAYQLRDDIIGVFGDEAVTGKSTEGDIREGKRTLLIEEFHRIASVEQRAQLEKHFGSPEATLEEVATVRTLLEKSGAKVSIEAKIEAYERECNELVTRLDLSSAAASAFSQLIALCLHREK